MSDRTIEIRQDKADLASSIAAALEEALDRALERQRHAHIGLTGGSMGNELMKAWAAVADGDREWSRVHLWWGDERFVPAGDDDRNDKQAEDAGLKKLGVPPANIHRMPSSDDGDVVTGAGAYMAELAKFSDVVADGLAEKPQMPTFDVLMLGMGPDGHVASLFPAIVTNWSPMPRSSPSSTPPSRRPLGSASPSPRSPKRARSG